MCTTALVTLLVLSGACGGTGSVETMRVQRTDIAVAPTPTPVPVYQHPLTGHSFTGSQAWQDRPVLSVKVENLPASRPQAGLENADVVYEELAEGGITRFIALFNSQQATRVGPVRSARHADPQVIAPLDGLFAYAGGVPPVVAAVRATSGVTDVGYDRVPDAYYRRNDRRAPHNLYTSTGELWNGRRGATPSPLFSFLPDGLQPPEAAPGNTLEFAFSGRSEQTSYVYDLQAGVYRRHAAGVPHLLEGGAQIAPRNVIVQTVSVARGSVVDRNGEVSPEPRVIGEGEAILLTGGRSWRGRWSKTSASSPTRFVDSEGNEMRLQPGQTWIELLPSGAPLRIS